MRFRFGKVMMVLAIAGLITACNKAVDQQEPDKLVREGLHKLSTQDTKFNFSGEAKLQTEVPAENKDSQAQASSASEDLSPSLVPMKQYQNLLDLISKSFTVKYTGAVDLSQYKIEVIPEYHYEAKNILLSLKFPIQVDLSKLAVYIDSAALTNFSDTFAKEAMPSKYVGERYVKVAVPEDDIKRLPLSDLFKDLSKATDDSYASLDAKSFSSVNVDDFGKKINAKYQVKLTTNAKLTNKMTIVALDSLSKSLQQQGQEAASKNGQYQQQDYEVLKQYVDKLNMVYKNQLNNDGKLSQYMEKMPIIYDYYLDDKGRIIAVRNKIQIYTASKDFERNVYVIAESQIDYSAPKFTITPTDQNTLNITSQLVGVF